MSRALMMWLTVAIACSGWIVDRSVYAADHFALSFARQQLTDTYFSEGVGVGDINGDGKVDVVHGPYWFVGPDFTAKHEIYTAAPQDRNRYANNFFSWVYDFNGDGRNDVLTAGFPGTPGFVYENPGPDGWGAAWPKHQVIKQVSNESPQFVDIVGDDQPELICTVQRRFGYATFDQADGFGAWTFHPVSDAIAAPTFGHGLGVGDVNGDGRQDILLQHGWLEQPATLRDGELWTLHKAPFAPRGGADMFAYDVDGDGDNDVITSLAAHEFGLAWYEQVEENGERRFIAHTIMGKTRAENRYGVLFSELHSVALADMDGDGLKDIVTGKTYWSHHRQSPLWDAGAVVYWFKLVRGDSGVDWIPMKADGEAGIGRQLTVADINADGLPDIVTGGMQGAHVLTQSRKAITEKQWLDSLPKPPKELKAGLSPEAAAQHMTVPPGFNVQLAAGEPQVHQPIAFCYDDRGRVWVAEAYTYPRRAPDGQGKDRIVILEDTDFDGTLDSRKVFVEGLNLVSGLEVGFGGVWVGAAPYLMFIPDRDGDDKPDLPPSSTESFTQSVQFPNDVPAGANVLLDGFGWQDTHEVLNAFIWGPDGWLYGCHGVFTHSKVGKPGTPDDQREPLNCGVWRYHPIRHEFEVFARGTSNPWGVDFDQHGQAFITACVIPHLWHVIPGARYHRQGGQHFNPHVYDDIKTIADHQHYAGNIRDHAWWGHEPGLKDDTSLAGGGHAHAGAMIYQGDNWPQEYRNRLYFNNIHGNRVNCDILKPEGSGYVGSHGKDFLFANDGWFRGINLKSGPDGTVLLIDWYDKNACHRNNPEIWDRSNGRVFRVSYGKPGFEMVDLGKKTNTELVKLQQHANEWHARTSRRILQEEYGQRSRRKDESKVLSPTDGLMPLLSSSKVVERLRGMWTMHVVTGTSGRTPHDEPWLLHLLDDPSEHVRLWALRLELEDRKASSDFHQRMLEMAASDPAPLVRLELASSLQRLPIEQRWDIAERLIQHAEDRNDHNLPLMYWYGIEPLVPKDPSRAMTLAASSRIPLITRYIIRRAASDNATLNHVIAALNDAGDNERQSMILDEMLSAFEGRVNIPMPPAWTPAYDRLVKSSDGTIRDKADQVAVVLGDKRIFPRLRQRLADDKSDAKKRRQALEILVRGRDPEAADTFRSVMTDKSLRGPAIRALAGFDDARTPPAILSAFASLTESERRDAVNTLTSRPAFANKLLDAMERGDVARTELHAYNVRQLMGFKDAGLAKRIRDVWGEIRATSADKKKQITSLKGQLTAAHLKSGDVGNGRRLFAKTCASCHTLFGTGGKIGPDITGSNRTNLDYILDNIVDPSAVMGRDYRLITIALVDGRIVSGMIRKETDSAITLQTINDLVVIARSDIDDRSISNVSMMPEKLLDNLKSTEVRDLVAYLGSPSQVALKGPAAILAQNGKVAGAIEGESMKIVNKSAGNTGSQPMTNFKGDRWSGNDHLWWTGAKPGAKLGLEFSVPADGKYEVESVLTRARDYGVVQLSIDHQKLGGPVDLYDPQVITTGVLSMGSIELKAGNHTVNLEIVGTNPKAVKGYMVGVDYIRLVPVD
jgi:putative membrane-bound dehydrogenase-like protein